MEVPLNAPPHAENFAYYVNVMLDDFSSLLYAGIISQA